MNPVAYNSCSSKLEIFTKYLIKISLLVAMLLSIFSQHAWSGDTPHTSKPDIMKNWRGFFDPQVRAHGAFGSEMLRPNECKYEFPAYYYAYITKCDYTSDQTKWKADWLGDYRDDDNVYTPLSNGRFDCICAVPTAGCWLGSGTYNRYVKSDISDLRDKCGWPSGPKKSIFGYTESCFHVFWNRSIALDPDEFIGCVRIPLAPSPPPFCQQFEPQPEIKVVPESTSTFFHPKIKIMIGSAVNKECANGQRIHISENCTDGSQGIVKQPTSKVAEASATGSKKHDLHHQNKQYSFDVYTKDEMVCAAFNDIGETSTNPTVCYEKPSIAKPSKLKYSEKDAIQFEIKGYDRNPVTLNVGEVHQETKLRAFSPKVNAERKFQAAIICQNEQNIRRPTKHDGSKNTPICDPGFSPRLSYVDDTSNPLICLEGWLGDNALSLLKRDGEVILLETTPNGFVPYRYDRTSGESILQSKPSILIQDSTQEILDTINPNNFGRFLIDPNPPSQNYGTYKYEQVPIPLQSYSSGGFNNFDVNSEVTFFRNNITSAPVKLKAEEIANKNFEYLVPLDPYANSLCVHSFPHTEYTDPSQEHFFETKGDGNQCNFLTIESWGGGGASSTSFGGGASNYVKAVVAIRNSNKKVLKITVGKGAKSPKESGDSSFVELCRSVERIEETVEEDDGQGGTTKRTKYSFKGQDCAPLIIASGARANGKAAASNNTFQLNNILLFAYGAKGLDGYSVPSLASGQAQGEISLSIPATAIGNKSGYIDYSNSDCSKSSGNGMLEGSSQFAGSGGCVNSQIGLHQKGANGKVKIICERWNT